MPSANWRSRAAHAFRRQVKNIETVNGNKIYRGIRGGLYTNLGTPVYNYGSGFYSTNKNFNKNAYMNSIIGKASNRNSVNH
jgi:hypothetical protein